MRFWEEWKNVFKPAGNEGTRRKTGPLLLLLAVGVGLLLLNSFISFGKKPEAPPQSEAVGQDSSLFPEQQLGCRLAEVLAQIRGVSDVEVFLTPETSGESELAADRERTQRRTYEDDREGGSREILEETERTTYVILRDPQGRERPLTVQEGGPRYRGVLVVAVGVEDVTIKARVVEALQTLLGLPAHRITVLPR